MPAELPISVLLLARDETRDLEELLPALAFAREVVMVWDPRGDPATRATAERLGARVFERPFEGFGAQRQFALERCTQDWVLWIDADERLAPGALERLTHGIVVPDERVPGVLPVYWGVYLRRESFFLGTRIRHCGWGDERVFRLFRRRCSRFDDALVHEAVRFVPPEERVGPAPPIEPRWPLTHVTRAVLEHHSYRTLADCETKLVRYGEANAEKAFRAGRRAGPLDVALRPTLRFLRQYVLQRGFLDGRAGLLLCLYAARQVRLKYARLAALSKGAS